MTAMNDDGTMASESRSVTATAQAEKEARAALIFFHETRLSQLRAEVGTEKFAAICLDTEAELDALEQALRVAGRYDQQVIKNAISNKRSELSEQRARLHSYFERTTHEYRQAMPEFVRAAALIASFTPDSAPDVR